MKIKNLNKLGLLSKTIDELEVPISWVFSDDEFNRPKILGDDRDYRQKAIDRLVLSKEDFSGNINLTYDILKEFVRIVCPYCKIVLRGNGGGSGDLSTINFRCESCVRTISLSVPSEHGFSVRKGL